MKNLFAFVAVAGLAGVAMARPVAVYNDFASYNAAVGGIHTYFEDFEGVDPSAGSVAGNVFNGTANYYSADSGLVNIANIGQGIDNEIGPFGSWDGQLFTTWNTPYYATGFTGIDFDTTATIDLYLGQTLVGSATAGGAGGIFEFFGFVSDAPFDTMVLNGGFYAIDAHYATKVPAPASLGLLGLGALAAGRRRR